MQRHLTAFEANLMETTSAGLLTLVATTSGLTPARANTTTNAVTGALRTHCGLQSIQLHHLPLITRREPSMQPW